MFDPAIVAAFAQRRQAIKPTNGHAPASAHGAHGHTPAFPHHDHHPVTDPLPLGEDWIFQRSLTAAEIRTRGGPLDRYNQWLVMLGKAAAATFVDVWV